MAESQIKSQITGVITLGQVALAWPAAGLMQSLHTPWQLHTERLLMEHAEALPMPHIRQIIAADCPRMQADEIRDPCGVHFRSCRSCSSKQSRW
jgi:hypothetical protein